jgi:outer membrane receptor protein involved in Fe transport
MRAAALGKGWSGKTRLADTLARVLAQRRHRVLAITPVKHASTDDRRSVPGLRLSTPSHRRPGRRVLVHRTVTLMGVGRIGTALAASLWLLPAQGQPASTGDPIPMQTVVVTGVLDPVNKSDLSNDPAAGPGSITVLRLPEEKKRGVRDYVELLKPVMGVAANNFDQGGIGFGFTMRGFSERSNGGGVAYSIDGVPVNLPSHALTNGYGDLTPLIPELLDTMVLTRGPFDVRFGANSLGGSMAFTTQDMPARGAAASAGNFDFGRLFVALPGLP